ncbi:MAG: hypothetical protein J5833_06455, partial [Victivallales bacterium]|nr:hypothetical protein [Victivallales bacterium]
MKKILLTALFSVILCNATGDDAPVPTADYDSEITQWRLQADPEGTVIICDFDKFSPKPPHAISRANGVWSYRNTSKFFAQAPGCIHPPGSSVIGDISYSPSLSGKYDVYLGVRLLPQEQNLYMRMLPDEKYHHLHAKPTNKVHGSVEFLFARDVVMDGKSISLSSAGFFFLGYIKLIPVANRRTGKEPVFSLVSIDNEAPVDEAAMIEEQIKSGHFKERHYVPAAKAAAPSAKSTERGFMLFPWNWTELMFPSDAPEVDGGDLVLKVSAARGESEPVSFGIRPLAEDGTFTLERRGAFGAGITADIHVTRYGIKRTTN